MGIVRRMLFSAKEGGGRCVSLFLVPRCVPTALSGKSGTCGTPHSTKPATRGTNNSNKKAASFMAQVLLCLYITAGRNPSSYVVT